MTDTAKIALLSDLHLTGRPEDPAAARLDAVLADILRYHGDAQALVVLGDLADAGAPAAYEALQARLSRLPMPVGLTVGNHDDRAAMAAVFGGAVGGFVQQSVEAGGVVLHLLDTLLPGAVHGALDDDRVAWLDRALAAHRAPSFLLMHHPPIALSLPAFDRVPLEGCVALEAVLAAHASRIEGILFGHCHMALSAGWRGIAFHGLPAVAGRSLPVFAEAAFRGAPSAPPCYSLLFASADGHVVHHIDVADPTEAGAGQAGVARAS